MYAQRYGLANALWESGEPERVQQAISIAQALLDATFPDDRNRVKDFTLDLLIEAGRWGDAVKLLDRFPMETTEHWLWTRVLITLKARGASSKGALAAFKRAVRLNGSVLNLLLGDELVDKDEIKVGVNSVASSYVEGIKHNGTRIKMTAPGAAQARHNAVNYAFTYGKFWFRDQWVQNWLREQSTDIQNWAAPPMKGVRVKEVRIPSRVAGRLSRCAYYDRERQDTPFKACSRCCAVKYCNSSCQKGDWPSHKLACCVDAVPEPA